MEDAGDFFNLFLLPEVWSDLVAADNQRNYLRLTRERRLLRDADNPLEWPEVKFMQNFRLTKALFCILRDDLRSLRGSHYETRRSIPLECKILVALSFFASGSYQRIVGEAAAMAQPTVSKCIKEITNLMNSNTILSKWINFPTSVPSRNEVKQGFYDKYGFPGVIGAIDGTHVAIIGPSIHEDHYFNRRGYHSLNVLIICDNNLKILAVNASYGGVNHDSHVWSMSNISNYVQSLNQSNVWLLGDSGYAQRPWLMTPVPNAAAGSAEARYNTNHAVARCTVERCIGVLKNRWRCLIRFRALHYEPIVCSKIVNACCILHNMMTSIPIAQENVGIDLLSEIPSPNDENEPSDVLSQGRAIRNRIIQMF